jgi:ERF superfamily
MSDQITMNWSMSPSIGKLVESLAKSQLKFDKVLKDSDNPAYRSKYADLATVIDATRPFLAAEGLTIVQMPHARFSEADAKELTLTTLLAHSSGEWISSDLTLPAMMRERFDAQSVGSAITYARRYALAAMTGVAQEDDDANKASGIGSKEAAQQVAKRKIKEATGTDESEPIHLVPYKDTTLAITGNSLALLRAELTEKDKEKVHIKWSGTDRVWSIPEAEGNMFASLCEEHKFKVIWDGDIAN